MDVSDVPERGAVTLRCLTHTGDVKDAVPCAQHDFGLWESPFRTEGDVVMLESPRCPTCGSMGFPPQLTFREGLALGLCYARRAVDAHRHIPTLAQLEATDRLAAGRLWR